MRKVFLFFVLSLSMYLAEAQTDSLLLRQLTKPIVDCQTISHNARALLSFTAKSNLTKQEQVAVVWKDYCPESKDRQAFELLLHIAQDRLNMSLFASFYKKYDYSYRYYYDEMLSSGYGKWLNEYARSLQPRLDQNSSEYLVSVYLAGDFEYFEQLVESEAFRESVVNTLYQKSSYKFFNSPFYTIGANSFLPVGKFSEYFTAGAGFDLGWGLPMGKWRFDLFFQLNLYVCKQSFEMYANNYYYRIKPTTGIGLNLQIARQIGLGSGFYTEFVGGVGYAGLNTDIENPNSSSDEPTYYMLGALDLFGGVRFHKNIFKRNTIGVQANYHYTPYKLDKKLVTSIGSQYVSGGVFFRF